MAEKSPFSSDLLDLAYGRTSQPSSGGFDSQLLDIAYGRPQGNEGSVLGDLGASALGGGNSLVSMVGGLYGLATGDMDNSVYQWARENRTSLDAMKSDDLKMRERRLQESIASTDGIGSQAAAAVWGTVSDPYLMLNMVVEQLPLLVATGGSGIAARAGATALGVAEKAAVRAGTAGAAVTGGAMNASDIASGTYEQIMSLPDNIWDGNQEFLDRSLDIGAEEAKKEIALERARITAGIVGIGSAATTFLPGSIEKTIVGDVGIAKGGLLKGVGFGIAGEGAQEVIEEGGGQFVSNTQVRKVDPNQDLLEGVGGAAGTAFALGGAIGGAGGGINSQLRTDYDPFAGREPSQVLADLQARAAALNARIESGIAPYAIEAQRAAIEKDADQASRAFPNFKFDLGAILDPISTAARAGQEEAKAQGEDNLGQAANAAARVAQTASQTRTIETPNSSTVIETDSPDAADTLERQLLETEAQRQQQLLEAEAQRQQQQAALESQAEPTGPSRRPLDATDPNDALVLADRAARALPSGVETGPALPSANADFVISGAGDAVIRGDADRLYEESVRERARQLRAEAQERVQEAVGNTDSVFQDDLNIVAEAIRGNREQAEIAQAAGNEAEAELLRLDGEKLLDAQQLIRLAGSRQSSPRRTQGYLREAQRLIQQDAAAYQAYDYRAPLEGELLPRLDEQLLLEQNSAPALPPADPVAEEPFIPIYDPLQPSRPTVEAPRPGRNFVADAEGNVGRTDAEVAVGRLNPEAFGEGPALLEQDVEDRPSTQVLRKKNGNSYPTRQSASAALTRVKRQNLDYNWNVIEDETGFALEGRLPEGLPPREVDIDSVREVMQPGAGGIVQTREEEARRAELEEEGYQPRDFNDPAPILRTEQEEDAANRDNVTQIGVDPTYRPKGAPREAEVIESEIAELDREERAINRGTTKGGYNLDTDIFSAIKMMGGINTADARSEDFTVIGDGTPGGLFRSSGKTFDELTELMQEAGYLARSGGSYDAQVGDANATIEIIRDAISQYQQNKDLTFLDAGQPGEKSQVRDDLRNKRDALVSELISAQSFDDTSPFPDISPPDTQADIDTETEPQGSVSRLGAVASAGGVSFSPDQSADDIKFSPAESKDSNKHGVKREYIVSSRGKVSGKPAITKAINTKNGEKVLSGLRGLEERHPDPLGSKSSWLKFERELLGDNETPVAPTGIINLYNNMDAWIEKHSSLTSAQLEAAGEGFELVDEMRAAYESGDATTDTTGKLMLWGMLSRMLSAHPHESAFLDAAVSDKLSEFIGRAVERPWTESDVSEYLDWAATAIPDYAPGKQGTSNLNDFGKIFLNKLSQRQPEGISGLEKLHNLIADQNVPTKDVRAAYYSLGDGLGIQNKVLSFVLLMTGRDDVVVLDRIQINSMWDSSKFGKLIYDDVAPLFEGAHGLARYEALERSLLNRIDNLYDGVGRAEDASVGRYHWESWVRDSGQVVSHPTVKGIINEARSGSSTEESYSDLGAPEGRFHTYGFGSIYARDKSGTPYVLYKDSGGKNFRFGLKNFKDFLSESKKPKNGVIPKGFSVKSFKEKGYPWYESEEVNREKLDALIRAFSEGEGTAEEIILGTSAAPEAGGTRRAEEPSLARRERFGADEELDSERLEQDLDEEPRLSRRNEQPEGGQPTEMDKALSRIREFIAEQEGRPASDADIAPVMLDAIPDERRQSAEFALEAARVFQKADKVSFVTFGEGTQVFDGATVYGQIVIAENATTPYHIVLGHELTHVLKRDHPDLYAQLEAFIMPKATASKASAKFHGMEVDTPQAREEYISDVVGNRFGEREFWEAMAESNPTGFRRIAQIARSLMQKLSSHFRKSSLATGDEVADLNAVRAEVAKVMGAYRDREAGTQAPLPEGQLPLFRRKERLLLSPKNEPAPFQQENERIREKNATVVQKIKQKAKRELTPGGLLPKAVFDEKITRDNQMASVEFDTIYYVKQLEKAVKSTMGGSIESLPVDQQARLSESLAGKLDESLPGPVKTAVIGMRESIDGLSKQYIEILDRQSSELLAQFSEPQRELLNAYMIAAESDNKREANAILDQAKAEFRESAEAQGLSQDMRQPIQDIQKVMSQLSLLNVIRSNTGTYVNRSYRAFDDSNWFKNVPDSVLNNARQYLSTRMEESGMEPDRIAERVEVVLNDILKEGTAYGSMESFIKESKLGAKDLSILQKRKDIAPEIRALLGEYEDPRVNFAKTTSKMARLIFNTRLLDKVKDVGMGEFLFTEDDRPANTTQIAVEGNKTLEPLNGLYASREVAQAFSDIGKVRDFISLPETIIRINGGVKFGKTVLAPTTQFRNFMSASFFAMANGHWDLRKTQKSLSVVREYFTRDGDTGKLAYLRRLKELGVVYDTPYAGEMMRLLEETKFFDGERAEMGKIRGSVKDLATAAQRMYQFGDDFWKIVGYENERANLIGSGMSEADAEVEAADRIRSTYPTYSLVGNFVNALRRFPGAGTFVSFPAEIIRTQYNMIKIAAEDMKTPGRRTMGIKRLVGMSMAAAMPYAVQALTKEMFDVSDDEEEAIRLMSPYWSENSNLMFMGRNDKGQLEYLDVSFLDPYNYFKRPINAALRDQPWEESFLSGTQDMIRPFFGTDIFAGALIEAANNKKATGGKISNESDSLSQQYADKAKHISKAVEPGIIGNARRIYKAVEEPLTPYGKVYTLEDEAAAFFGFRTTTFDPKTALRFRSYEIKERRNEASAQLRRVLTDPNLAGNEGIEEALERSLEMRQRTFDEALRLISASRSAGLTDVQIQETLKGTNFGRLDLTYLMEGKVPPMTVSPMTIRKQYISAFRVLGQEKAQQVLERYAIAQDILSEQFE